MNKKSVDEISSMYYKYSKNIDIPTALRYASEMAKQFSKQLTYKSFLTKLQIKIIK